MQVSALALRIAASNARSADLDGGPEKTASSSRAKWRQAFYTAATAVLLTGSAATAADLSDLAPAASIPAGASYDWTGLYAGMHVGTAWGSSKYNASTDIPGYGVYGLQNSGTISLANRINNFSETGSWSDGLQMGYNYQLSNRVVIGAEADATFSAYPDAMTNLSIGGQSNQNNSGLVYGENVYASGSVRGRLGYSLDNWLLYATGGLAWEVQQSYLFPQGLSNALASGANSQYGGGVQYSHYGMRLGWAAGGGVETALTPHWSVRAEYLYSGYGNNTQTFGLGNGALAIPALTQRVTSNLSEQEVRVGLNYQFGGGGALSEKDAPVPPAPGMESDRFNVHAEFTGIWQGYPAFRSPYELLPSGGGRSLPGGGQGRETTEVGLYIGTQLWKGAEFWVEPEIDQGFGVANTTGLAGYASAGAFKLGLEEPYARINHFFFQQTIDLGGKAETIAPGLWNFAQTTTEDRLVLTVGKYSAPEIFGRNTYYNPRTDFINWSYLINLPYDFGGDAWTTGMGGAAEWYVGNWTLRAGIFDLSAGPSGGNPLSQLGAVSLDPSFKQFNAVAEIERRYSIADEPGKIKLLGYVDHGMMGKYTDAIALYNSGTSGSLNPDTGLVRKWADKPGVSLNWEQQVTKGVGVFAQAGWMNGAYEVFDTSDVDRSVTFGVAIDGDRWGRPADRIGIAGAINGISKQYQQYLAAGGMGSLIGEGQLPHPGTENILETYYRFQYNAAMAFTLDYQFIDNPAYNTDRGPVNLFAGRVYVAF